MRGVPVISEQEVLRRLNIPDFRHLSKEKVMSFASLLPYMDPATAQKALDQFPDFAKTVGAVAHEYGDIVKKALGSNDESMKSYYSIASSIIATIQKQLDNDTLSFDERMHIMELLVELQRDVGAKDTENKKFHRDTIIAVGAICISFLALAVSLLGGNTNIRLPFGKK